jgi:hypothetical protein
VEQRFYYLVTSLPALGALGSAPPLSPRGLLERLDAAPLDLATAIFLPDDLLQRESFLAGRREPFEPAVLTSEQIRGEAPLPALLDPHSPAKTRAVAADAVWEACYAHAAAMARRHASRLLAEWVRYEVGLRNALAADRARLLGLDPESWLVARELGAPQEEFAGAVRAFAAAPDPLRAQRALDRARWSWSLDHDDWFGFGQDEVAAYALRLGWIARWHRLSAETSRSAA